MTFLYPIPPEYRSRITQTYAEHVAARIRNGWKVYNGGIDWGIPVGTAISAAAPGTVIRAEMDASGYGLHVRIQHADNVITLYGHLSSVAVKVGDAVTAGQVIGESGNTGNSTGPHLHFEARNGSGAFDPQPFLVEERVSENVKYTAKVMASDGLTLRQEPSRTADKAEPYGILPYAKDPKIYQIDEIENGYAHIIDRGWVAIGPEDDPWLELTPTGNAVTQTANDLETRVSKLEAWARGQGAAL